MASNFGRRARGFAQIMPVRDGAKNSSGATMGISGERTSRTFLFQITHNDSRSAFSGGDIREILRSRSPEMVIFSPVSLSASEEMFINYSSFLSTVRV